MDFVSNAEATNRIKSLRVRKGLTQAEIAEKLGVSTKVYIRYENQPYDVPIKRYQQIADILGCKASDFFVAY